MMDIKSKIVLKLLSKECPNGAYKIIEVSDIISAMPAKYRVDSDTIEHILTYLERQDCIDIKYDDTDTYCLCLLPYGTQIVEDGLKKEKEAKKSPKLLYPLVFFLSFLGCFLGCLVFYFIFIFK